MVSKKSELLIATKKWIQNIPVVIFSDGSQKQKKPLIIMSHGFMSKKEDLIPYLEDLARMGYYAVGMDNRLHGERNDGGFSTVFSEGNNLNCYKLFQTIKENADDIRVLIDYFTQDDEVDIRKVGMLGISMGGFTTYRAVSIDKRIKVAVPFISSPIWGDAPNETKTDNRQEVLIELQKLSNLYAPSNTPDNFYPTALLMQVGGADGHFNLEKFISYQDVLKSSYKNDPDRIRFLIHEDVAHNVTPEMWEYAKEWILKFL